MHNLTKNNYLYFIVFMLMANTYLPLVFNNLPPFIRSHHIWTIIWGFSLLMYKPSVIFNKTMLYLLTFGFFLFFATKTVWINIDDWNLRILSYEFYEIVIGFSVITYFVQTKDYLSLAQVVKWSLIFIFITAVMTIISSAIDPMYARNLTGVSVINIIRERDIVLGFKRFGGGSYSTAVVFMCLFPVLIYYYKNIKISLLSKKQIIFFGSILFIALLAMQIFGNILIAIISIIFSFSGIRKLRQSFFSFFLVIILFTLIPKDIYVNALQSTAGFFGKDSELNYKFNDLAKYIEFNTDIQEDNSGTGHRVQRYPMLLETFSKSPLLGCYFFSEKSGNGYQDEGAHLYWMNKLTITGIIGLSFFLLIPYNFIKNNLRFFNSSYKFTYILASLSILSYGLMKAIVGRETWYAFFIILPGMYYLPLLKKGNKK